MHYFERFSIILRGFLFFQEKYWQFLVKFYPFRVTTEKVTCQFLTCVWFDMGYLWDNKLSFIKNILTYLSTAAGIWITQECTQDGQKHIYFTHVVPFKTNSQMCLISQMTTLYGPEKYVFVRHKILWVDIYFYVLYLHMKVFEQ